MPDPAPAPVAQQTTAPATPEVEGTDQGLRIEAGFVGSSFDTPRAQRIKQAMSAAIGEVGEVSAEQRAAEMAGERPTHAKDGEEAEEEPAEPKEAAPAKEKAKAKGKDAAKTETEAPPTPAEHAPGVNELIHERRRLRANAEKQKRELEADYQGRLGQLQQHTQRLQPLADAAEAWIAGDFDGLAQALGKFKGEEVKDWETLQGEALSSAANPLHREIRAMKARERARDEQERRAREQAAQAQQQQQRQAQEQQWVASIADDLGADEDAAVAELIDVDPRFADYVYTEQRKNHEQHGEIVPAREGAERALAQVWKSVAAWNAFAQKHANSPLVQKITGVRPAPEKAEKGTASPNGESGTTDRNGVRQRVAKAPPAVSQNRTAEAAAQGPMNKDAIKRMWAERMNATTNRANSGDAPLD